MKEDDISKWEVTREKGKLKFILQTGILSWGLPMFGVMTFFVNRREGGELTMGRIGLSAITWAIGGILFGYIMWMLSEKKYLKFKSSENE